MINDFLIEGRPLKTLYRKIMVKRNFQKIENRIVRPYIRPRALNVGCGMNHYPGVWSMDNRPECNPDFLGDANNLASIVPWQWQTVIAAHVVEHLNDPEHFYAQVWDILNPGGIFILICPNFERMGSVGYYRDKTHIHEMVPGREWARFRRNPNWEIVSFNKLAYRFPYSFDLIVRKK